MRDGFQMVRVDAPWNTAEVIQLKSGWYLSDEPPPYGDVGVMRATPEPDAAIAVVP